MSYLGQVELKSSEIRRIDVTGSTSATHTLTWTPPSEQSLIITINGIKQQNNYSISGVTLTLDDALLSADKMEVIGILDIGEAVVPPDDSISTAKIQDDAVTADKLANSINTEIAANTAKVTNATHTGDVTGATALTIAVDAVDIPMLSATGTASATTYLRGDNAWSAIDTGTSWQAVTTGATLTVVAGNGYPINTTSNTCTVTLPASASVGDTIELVDYAGTWDSNAITLDPQSLNLKGASTTATIGGARNGIKLVYVDATQGWVTVTSTTSELISRQVAATGGTVTTYAGYKVHTFLTSADFVVSAGGSIDIMMVAGGGGGGGSGGGGGAGGMIVQAGRNVSAATYAIVIGGGGASSGATSGNGTTGSNTTFNSTDLVAMGGGGGGHSETGLDGGSGGGNGYTPPSESEEIQTSQSGDSGTYGFGNDGGAGGGAVAPGYSGGGGGGAGAAGQDATAGAAGGNGGAGKDNLYRTGANITYGGGGGGSTRSGTVGTGGSGGGGAAGAVGTANFGGGGGGGAGPGMTAAYAGGSGIVVIRYTV